LVTGSDAIDQRTVTQIQQLLRAPVKQFYGLSEASPLIAVTPESMIDVPEGAVGKVNPAWSVQCLDEDHQPVAVGQTGQIAIQGGIINPVVSTDDTAERVRNGWLLTGDMGYVDAAGYLFFAGRADDRINRAGEKISVAFIEKVLREIPGVADAVVFGAPDSEYGQRVAAAIVCDDQRLQANDIRLAASQKLGHDRLPEHIVITDRLPTSAGGKIQRRKLADHYKVGSGQDDAEPDTDTVCIAPRNTTEEQLARIWRELLEVETVGIHDTFLELGGNSMLAIQAVAWASKVFDVQIPLASFLGEVTIAELAVKVTCLLSEDAANLEELLEEIEAMSDEEARRHFE
jgi:long-subunit acyl-CoA synthetase (AMP-forming)/acyl carrier protein